MGRERERESSDHKDNKSLGLSGTKSKCNSWLQFSEEL